MSFEDNPKCPKCEGSCWRDSVDVGVGIIHGPWGCEECGWSSDTHYDRSEGPSKAELKNPDFHADQYGGMRRKSAIREEIRTGLARFGLADLADKPLFSGEKETGDPDDFDF